MWIGVDFGTTHTSAGLYDGQELRIIPLDPHNQDPGLLRSLIYITKEQEKFVGVQAAKKYLIENTGRPVRYEWKHVGTIENIFSQDDWEPLIMIREVYVEEDVGAPGRLLQSVKTGLRDKGYTGTNVYGKFYTLQDLIAIILAHVKKNAELYLNSEIENVVLGHPVKFSDDPITNQYALQRLREAAQSVGFKKISFEQEPIAAALFYTNSVFSPQTVLIFDFGGGTLDLTVMKIDSNNNKEILSTRGILLGGDDFDSILMRRKIAAYFGTDSMIGQPLQPFPAGLSTMLEQWQTIPDLSKEKYMLIIKQGTVFSNNPKAFRALECLVKKNYGFRLFEHIEKAKQALSRRLKTRLDMQVEEIDLSVEILRREFESYIANEVKKVEREIDILLNDACLSAREIDSVVTTGGSSLIPAFKNMLRRKFGQKKVRHSDTFTSVVSGLAIRAYELENGSIKNSSTN